ncbi:hypothetical protein ACM15_14335 [Parabacteroides goldsteinii]|uniref:Bacterial repeat domain-containing protein n=2 Tax=Parabacteroides goldsteinii TaxID=328812 RepID=A0A0J6CIK8_9BACT|nr:hypothetical protein ACM15_14335 [Parabacteroides goldsteinii]
MNIKEFLQKGMASRLQSLLVAFFMMVTVQGMAQKNNSSGGSSAESRVDLTVSKPVLPVKKRTKVPLESSGQKILTRSEGGNILKITSKGVNTEYADWQKAMKALKSGDEITLLSKVTLYEASGDKMPDKSCTINGDGKTLEFNTDNFAGSCSLQEDVTFKNIHLEAGDITANGKKVVFDSGVTVKDDCDVYGGGGLGVDVETTSITIKDGATLDWVYGGGYAGKVTGNTNIVVEGGTVTAILGGGYNTEAIVEGNANITINNTTFISTIYGGGNNAPVKGTANIKVENGNVNYIIGGGHNTSAICKNTNLEIIGGTFGKNDEYRYNVMGGGYSAPVEEKATVTISGGTFNCFVTGGGGFDNETTATCGSTELNITGGTFNKWTYGGGWESPVLRTATVKVSGTPSLATLCGGGARSTASCQNTDVQVSSNIGGWLFAGGETGSVNGTAKLTVTSGSITKNIYGGGASASCNKTEVTLSGGEVSGSVFGGGESGDVIEESHLTISGTPTISGDVFGGSRNSGTTVGSTRVEISGGTFNYINGGGYEGDVTGECYLAISGTPTISGNVFGGSNQPGTTVGSTRVEISGGTFQNNIFGGGWGCDVQEDTHVSVTNGVISYNVLGGGSQGQVFGSTNVVFDGGTITSGNIFGGGWGDEDLNDGYSPDKGRVGSANVTINGNTDKVVYGNGFCSSVTNNINITVNSGNNISVYGLYSDSNYALQAGGDVNIKLNGGEICMAGLVVNNLMAENTIGGKACITVSPSIDATNLSEISSGNPKTGVLKDATFVFKDCGTADNPFVMPYDLQGFTTIELNNSYVKSQINTSPKHNTAICLDINKPNTLLSDGWSQPVKIAPFSDKAITTLEDMTTLFVIKDAAELPDGEVFEVDPSSLSSYSFFRVGDTYRVMSGVAGNDFLRSVTVDPAISGGSLSVSWKDTKLFSGDKVPFRDTNNTSIDSELTIEVESSEGYLLKEGTLKVYKTGDESTLVAVNDNKFILPDYDVTVTAEFAKISHQITILPVDNGSITASPGTDVAEGVEVALTVSPADGYRLKSGSLKVYKTGDEGTTIALSGTSFNMPTYGVTVTAEFEQIPYQITISSMENGNITASPGTEVAEGVEVALTVSPADGYRLKSGSLQVYKTGDANTTVALSGNSFRMPAYDVTVMAEFEGIPAPLPPVYYTVTLPSVKGATTDPAPSDYEVESSENFRFYLTLDEDYNQSEPIVTTDRGETITPRSSDGAYIVKYIRNDVEIFIDGIVKNPDPVANETVDTGGIKIYAANGYLHIQAPQPEQVHIFAPNGRLLKAFRTSGNEEQIALPKGIYLIRVTNQCVKVVL